MRSLIILACLARCSGLRPEFHRPAAERMTSARSAGGVSEGLYPAVILKTIAVKNNRRNACSFRRLSNRGTYRGC